METFNGRQRVKESPKTWNHLNNHPKSSKRLKNGGHKIPLRQRRPSHRQRREANGERTCLRSCSTIFPHGTRKSNWLKAAVLRRFIRVPDALRNSSVLLLLLLLDRRRRRRPRLWFIWGRSASKFRSVRVRVGCSVIELTASLTKGLLSWSNPSQLDWSTGLGHRVQSLVHFD